MIRRIAEDMVFFLVERHYADIENREVLTYGVEVILSNVTVIAMLILSAIVFNCPIHLLTFFLFFVPLRMFTGGYHAATHSRCLIYSTIMFIASYGLAVSTHYSGNMGVWLFIFIAANLIIVLYGPIMNENNILSDEQYKVNKKRAIMVLAIQDIAILIILYSNTSCAVDAIVWLTMASVLQIFGSKNAKEVCHDEECNFK